jgi:hypothetical protein
MMTRIKLSALSVLVTLPLWVGSAGCASTSSSEAQALTGDASPPSRSSSGAGEMKRYGPTRGPLIHGKGFQQTP